MLPVIVFMSCTSTKLPRRNDTVFLNATNFKKLDGEYLNGPEAGLYNSDCLWCYLLFPKSKPGTDWVSHRVKLQMLDKKTLRAQLIKTEEILIVRTMKGKIKNGAFRVKRSRVRGVPAIFFTSESIVFQIAPGLDSTLKLDAEISSYGNVFLFSAGSTKYEEAVFKKLLHF